MHPPRTARRSHFLGPLVVALAATTLVLDASPGTPAQAASAPTAEAQSATSPSWNRNVACNATVTTLADLLGSQRSSSGGATFAGGRFRPGVPDARSVTQPCAVGGVSTFVELRRVVVGACAKINKDGDWTCGLTDPSRPTGDLNAIHIETDSKVRARGGWTVPAAGTPIDVQGFVYWDPNHTTAAFHNHSGWELHSFTAWRHSV